MYLLPAMPYDRQVENDETAAITGAGGMTCDPALHSKEANRLSVSDGSLPIGNGRGTARVDLNVLPAMPYDGQVSSSRSPRRIILVAMAHGDCVDD
jgi:hypothetical protein